MPYVAGQRDLCGVDKYVMLTLFLNFVVFINCLSDTVLSMPEGLRIGTAKL